MTPGDDDHHFHDEPSQRPWGVALLLRGLAVALLVLAGLAIGTRPLVDVPPAPSPANVDRARDVLKQIADGNNVAGTRIALRLTQAELDGLSALVSQAVAPVRVQAQLVQPRPPLPPASARRRPLPPPPPAEIVARFSRALPLGGWLNIEARAYSATGGKGLPVVRMTIGRIPVPSWLARFALRRAWLVLQGDVEEPRSLDQAIPVVRISVKRADMVLIHPGRSAAFAGLSRFGGIDPDRRWVAQAYCALTPHADADLASIIRRAWRLRRPVRLTPEEQNRALMIAVAMRSIPEYRDRLAGDALDLIGRCINPPVPITLAGRNDLAKHWAMSAALAASLGGQMAQSLGVWKELSDSLTGGTGFSFVDIAADRSGERFANAAMNPQLARFVQTRLAATTQPQLLPGEALSKPEGLDAAMFEQIYRSADSPEYASAVAAIDLLLDNIGVPKP